MNLIEHPSIVQISDYGETPDGTAYLVMEYLRGEPLNDRLERLNATAQRLPWAEAAQLGAQIADALGAAHEKAIVHRDLKPGNVMLVRDPAVPGGERAKILDFGIAKLTQGQAHGTATNALIGTPQYMSPEQCRGAGGVDGKTDVYALGVILYEMLAGRPPFLADSTVEYMGQHVFKDAPSLYDYAPKAHPPLVVLIHRLLVKDKALRPAMPEVSRELTRLVASVSGVRPGTTPAPAADSDITRVAVAARVLLPLSTLSGSLGQTLNPSSRRRRQVVGAAVAVATAGGLSVLLFWHPMAKQAAPAPTAGPAVQVAVPESPSAVAAQPVQLREKAPLAAAGRSPAVAVAPPDQPAGATVTAPADPPRVAKSAAAALFTAKTDAPAAKSSAPLQAHNPQESASESSKVVKHLARVRQVPEAPLPVKPTTTASKPSQPLKPTNPPVKRPIRYED